MKTEFHHIWDGVKHAAQAVGHAIADEAKHVFTNHEDEAVKAIVTAALAHGSPTHALESAAMQLGTEAVHELAARLACRARGEDPDAPLHDQTAKP